MEKKFRCTVCGNICSGAESPAQCVVCGATGEEFAEIKEEK